MRGGLLFCERARARARNSMPMLISSQRPQVNGEKPFPLHFNVFSFFFCFYFSFFFFFFFIFPIFCCCCFDLEYVLSCVVSFVFLLSLGHGTSVVAPTGTADRTGPLFIWADFACRPRQVRSHRAPLARSIDIIRPTGVSSRSE